MQIKKGAVDMNYDTIILEMLSRIQALEDEIKYLKENNSNEILIETSNPKITTNDICDFIDSLKQIALEEGQASLILIANDIHKELELKSKMPLVCNAMKRCMPHGDEVIFETASGYSSTLQIQYYLAEWEQFQKEQEYINMLWTKIVEEFSKNPRNVQTRPTDGRTPKWFFVGVDNEAVYVEKGRAFDHNSAIKGKRYLEKEKLNVMLDLHKRRKMGESVSVAASATTQNQVYWYGIFTELGV